MTYKIIDSNNPVLLLNNYEINKDAKRNKKADNCVLYKETLNVWMLHFNSLFKDIPHDPKLKDLDTFVGCADKADIIHSTVGLFDICLPDMDIGTIYGSVVDKNAYTIVAFSSQTSALQRLINKLNKVKDKTSKIETIKEFFNKTENKSTDISENDVYSSGEDKEDDFQLIFNDDDESVKENVDETDEDEEDSSDEDFSRGYNGYIKKVYQRKLNHLTEEIKLLSQIGFENQIVGAISFKLRYVDVRRIVHVTMLGVLKEYRGLGVGKHLINLVLDQKIMEKYDAVVVHADFSACEFFKKFGFSDDKLLNTQWHSLEPEYTNCSLLTYVSAYSNQLRNNKLLAEEFCTAEMEVDIKLWQKKVTEVHCFQFQVFQKMKMEIEYLKETVKNQDKVMKSLMKELRESNKEKVRLERFLKTSSNIFDNEDSKEFSSLRTKKNSNEDSDPLDNVESRVQKHFHESSKMIGESDFIKFINFTKADPPPLILAEFKAIKRSLNILPSKLSTKSVVSNRILYFCEPFSMKTEDKNKILIEGFDKGQRKPGSQGLGYYFASNPATAAIYSNNKSIIVADVILGNIYRNTGEVQPLKDSSPDGYESVLVASLYTQQSNNNAMTLDINPLNEKSCFYSQEFVIFDSAQALPLGLIDYSIIDDQ